MRKILLGGGLFAAVALMAAATPAAAFVPGQGATGVAAGALADVVEVKRSKRKARPRGWDRGRKVGSPQEFHTAILGKNGPIELKVFTAEQLKPPESRIIKPSAG